MTIDYTASIVVHNSWVRKPQQTGSQPGMAAIPARGQLKREKSGISRSPFAPESLASRVRFVERDGSALWAEALTALVE